MNTTGSKIASWLLMIGGAVATFLSTQFGALADFDMTKNIAEDGVSIGSFFAHGTHCLWYALLLCLLWWGFTAMRVNGFGKYFVSILVCGLLAVSDEAHQVFLARTTFSWGDVMLCIGAALIPAVLIAILASLLSKKRAPTARNS